MSYTLYLTRWTYYVISFPIFHIRLIAIFISEITLKYVLEADTRGGETKVI